MSFEGFAILPTDPPGASTFLVPLTEEAHVRQSILLLLSIRKGERPLAPYFGNQLHDFLYQPNHPYLRKQIEQQIVTLLRTQEPRAKDVEVQVAYSPENPTILEIGISFRSGDQSHARSALHLSLYLQGGKGADVQPR